MKIVFLAGHFSAAGRKLVQTRRRRNPIKRDGLGSVLGGFVKVFNHGQGPFWNL